MLLIKVDVNCIKNFTYEKDKEGVYTCLIKLVDERKKTIILSENDVTLVVHAILQTENSNTKLPQTVQWQHLQPPAEKFINIQHILSKMFD